MTQSRRRFLGASLALAATRLNAQERGGAGAPGSIIVPFTAGSTTDLIGREVARLLGKTTGAPYVVDNAPGASGVIAVNQLLRRARDGKSLLVANSGLICNTPFLSSTPPGFKPKEDLVPICTLAESPIFVFVGKDYPASNLAELKQSVQGRQEPLLYSVTAAGSALHVGGALVLHMLGIKGQAVPYRNSDQVVIDVSENRLPMGVHVWNSMAPFVQSGRIKVLAVLSERPFSAAPQIATADSQGLKGVDIYGWLGLFMAAGESDGTIQGYEGRLRAFFSDREFPDFISKLSYVPSFRDSRSSRSFVDAETRRYEKLMKELNISV